MAENISKLPAATTMTTEQALASAAQLDLSDVLVIGYNSDGGLAVRSSRMTREQALWLLEEAKMHSMGFTRC